MTEGEEGVLARYRAPALEKGLDILELLAKQPTGMSLTAIAKEMGRSLGEIYRVALVLEARGYIRREGDGDSFSLSLRLFELATEHPPINRLLAAALPEMQALTAQAHQSCHLTLIDNDRVLVVAQVDSPMPMRYTVRLGARFPILETSSGAVFIAFAGKPELVRRAAAQTPEFEAGLDVRLEAIRKTGGERRESLVVSGVINLARPVFDLQGVVAVLTIPFLAQRGLTVNVDGAERLLAEAATRLSGALGGRDAADRHRMEQAA
jgi:DNA-binding IclR family transcriptional regulator